MLPFKNKGNVANLQRGGKKVVIDNKKFDSMKEAERYLFLKDQQDSGKIADLQCQIRYRFIVDSVHICDYIADFVYTTKDVDGQTISVTEDFKSAWSRTKPEYRIKKKLLFALYNITLKEVLKTQEEI